ncbi:MAG: response regulator [Puniceicoccaceae bacterium]
MKHPQLFLLCVDDEPEVLEAVENTVAVFEKTFSIETAESAAEARRIIADYHQRNCQLALILCDHIMPNENGVELLKDLAEDPRTRLSRKILLTGQAGLDATVDAVNHARLDHYLAKPWDATKLIEVVRQQLTNYVIAANLDPMPFLSTLDTERLSEFIRSRGNVTDR